MPDIDLITFTSRFYHVCGCWSQSFVPGFGQALRKNLDSWGL